MRRTLPQERIEGLLQDSRGLTTTEVSARRARYGANDIVKESRLDWRDVFGTTARDPMAWFLVATAGLFYYVGDTAEANVLLAAILPIVGMDLYLHRRTQASTAGLAGSLATTARVRRDNAESTIATSDVVPGDLVIVGPSEMFAADGIVLQGEHLQVDESALTGESWPVQKSLIDRPTIEPDGVVIDDEHWVQAGTRLLTGEAVVRIVNTGAQTQYGEIVRAALFEAHEMTPLQSAIGRLVGVLVIAAIGLCLLLAGVRLYQGFGFVDALQSALTLAVAALPEEFPVVFTVFLGVGVYRLARRHALVRRAVVVENIGRVTTICTDKTGTITAGLVQLHEALPDVGSRPESVIEAGALASRQESGDPLDSAILRRASSPPLTRLARSFPFTEDRKRETNVYRGDRDDVLLAYTKGAPETVFELCEMDAAAMAHWQAEITRLASAGFKVIACAHRSVDSLDTEPTRGFQFSGLLVFEDPVRESVPEAIAACRQAGIHIVMVTGDHPTTASAIARRIGLGQGEPRVVSGELFASGELGNLSFREIDVVSRAVPSQKVEVVRALQQSGEVVAVTGDGVNDVPALKASDISFAMGRRGTRSARETADIVLLDETFNTITRAIAEGRQMFENLRLGFAYLLLVHIPLVATAAFIPLAGYPLLYLPIHIVWLELVIHPTVLLAFQADSPDGALAPVNRTAARFFSTRNWIAIALLGFGTTAMIAAAYDRSLGDTASVDHGRSMALALLTLGSAAIVISLRGLRSGAALAISSLTVLMTAVFVQLPVLDNLLHLAPLHVDDWLIACAGALVIGAGTRFGGFVNARR